MTIPFPFFKIRSLRPQEERKNDKGWDDWTATFDVEPSTAAPAQALLVAGVRWLKSSQAHGALSRRYLRPLWQAHAAARYPVNGPPCESASAWATLGLVIRSLLAALRQCLVVVKGSDRRAGSLRE